MGWIKKIIFYIIGFAVATMLSVLLAHYTGFMLGFLPMYGIAYLVVKGLTGAIGGSDSVRRAAEELGQTPFDYIKHSVPKKILDYCESERGNRDELKKGLKIFVKNGDISGQYADILLEEYELK